MKCIFCDNEFEQKQTGRTPKFCSAKCRVYFNRGIGVGEKIVELQKNLVPTELVEEEMDVRDVNKVTGEVYENKEDKLSGLKAMMESVNQKYEAPFEPKAKVEAPPEAIYIDTGAPRPPVPRPNVPLPAKRVVEYDGEDRIELIFEDNPL